MRQWFTQRRIARVVVTLLFIGLIETATYSETAVAAVMPAPTISSITPGDGTLTVNMVTANTSGNFWTYQVVRRDTSGSCANPYTDGVNTNTGSLSSTISLTGLTNGCNYLVRVAINLSGIGNFSESEAMPNNYGNWLNLVWANDAGTGVSGINRTPITSGCKSETTTTLNYSTGSGVSPGGTCNTTYFTGYYSGYVKAPFTGTVTFTLANNDDAAVLAIQGNTIATQGGAGSTTGSVTMTLNQVYRIEFWAHNDAGPGASSITWSYNGGSATAIPASNLGNDPSVLTADGGCPLGMAARCAAGSALEIKQATGTNIDGQYWINISGTPTLVYCIMNSAQGGGGWMLAMRGKNSDSTFKYTSSLWVNNTLTGTTSYPERWANDTYRNTDAKYAPFTSMNNNQLMALFPAYTAYAGGRYSAANTNPLTSIGYGFSWAETYTTTGSTIKAWTAYSNGFGGNSYNVAQPNGPTEKTNDPTSTSSCIANPASLTNLFLNANRCAFRVVGSTYAVDSASPYPYSAIGDGLFYTQTQIGFFGINYGSASTASQRYRARIGFGWNENGAGDETSNDGTAGIGLDNANATTMAAGTHNQCCQTQSGVGTSVQMAFEIYVRNTQSAPVTGPSTVRITAGRTSSTAVGQAFSQTVTSGSATYRISPLRPGFSVDPSTGTLRVSGGLSAGTYYETVTATDGNGASAAVPVTINVVADSTETDTALSFNGSSQYLASSATYFTVGDFTMEAWVRPADTCSSTDRVITNFGQSWLICNTGYYYTTFPNSSDTGWTYLNLGIPVRVGEWIHLAVVRSSGTITAYVNNTQAMLQQGTNAFVSSYSQSSFSSTAQPQYIGGNATSGTKFNGLIDEVKIFRTARTLTQIWSGAHSQENVSNSNLLSYYDFNEGSGSTAFNRAQNATASSDLTISGPTFTPVATTTVSGSYTYVTVPRTLISSLGGWKVPSNVSLASVLVVGGGGGGSARYSTQTFSGAGGGGGGVFEVGKYPFTPNSVQYIRVGTGGRGGVNGADTTTHTPGWRGESTTVGALSAGGGGGGSYTTNNQQEGGAGTAGGGGGGATEYWNAYNAGNSGSSTGAAGGAGSNLTIGGVTYTGRSGGKGAVYVLGQTASSGPGGGAGGDATPNINGSNAPLAVGPGVTSSYSGTSREYGRGGISGAMSSPAFVLDPISPGNGGDGWKSGNATDYGAAGANGLVIIRWLNATVPSYTKPTNAYLNVGMTETFTTNVASDSATVDLIRTFRWESSTNGTAGPFTLIKQGTGAANAAFSWVPTDTSTSGSNYLYRLIVTDSDTAGLFITDSSTAFAVINRTLSLTSKSTITKTTGVTKTETFTVTFGTPSYSYTLTPDAAFFSLDTSTAGSPRIKIADTATVGTYYETFTVTDSVSASITVPLTIVVSPPPSFSAASNLVDSGTVVYLDAGNSASYSGTGTNWNDMSGRALSANLAYTVSSTQVTVDGTSRSNATMVSSCSSPTFSSNANGSLVLNGSNQCGYIANYGYLETYTVEMWVKRDGPQSGWYTSILTTPYRFDNDPINISIFWTDTASVSAGVFTGATNWKTTTGIYIEDQTWVHLSVTYTGGTLRMMKNANSGAAQSNTGAAMTWDKSKLDPGLLIGQRWGQATANTWFKGSIATIRIYSRALSDAEILQNYNATKNRFVGTLNENLIAQKYASRFVDTYTVTAGSESITATFTTNALSGIKWDTSTARSLVLTLQDTLTPGTYYDTITATDIYGSISRLPLTFKIAKADTLTVSMDTATVVVYNGSPLANYPRATIKGLKGSDTATSLTRFASTLYSETTTVPTNADTYTVRGNTPTFTVGSLTYYEGIIYETTTAVISKAFQRPLNIYMYGGVVGSPFYIYLQGGNGTGIVTETLTGVASLTGCAINNHFLTAAEQKQGFCEVRVVKAGDQNYYSETQTVQMYFMAYINNQPLGQVGSGSTIGLNGRTSLTVDDSSTVRVPVISGFSKSGSTLTINGQGFGSLPVTVTFERYVDAATSPTPTGGGTVITVTIPAAAVSGPVLVITAGGRDSIDWLDLP